MARPRPQRRGPFTATGSGRRLDETFGTQEVPSFKPKHANPPYLSRRIVRQQRGPQGAD